MSIPIKVNTGPATDAELQKAQEDYEEWERAFHAGGETEGTNEKEGDDEQ